MGHRLYPCSKNSRGRDGGQIKGIDEAQLISDSEIASLLLLLSAHLLARNKKRFRSESPKIWTIRDSPNLEPNH